VDGGGSFPGVKGLVREVDHSPLSPSVPGSIPGTGSFEM
jgi:hypothetical protein